MSDWTPSQQTQQEIQLFVQSLLERLPVLLGIDEAIAGCEVTNTDPYSTGTVPRYIKVRINDYLQDVYYRGQPQNLAVGDFVSVLHYRQGNIYEVFGSSGTTGATWQWKLLSPDGTIDPVIYTDNSGNTLTQTGAVLVGADASLIDFPEARLIVSQDDSGHSYAPNIAIVGESACDAATNAVGIGGVAKVVDNSQARGVVGRAVVDASDNTGEAIGVQGLSNPTHAGGTNIGVLGTATNGANNYSFYGEAGKFYNADDIVLAAGKLVDGVEVSTHDHSGGANMGVQIDIEDTTTTEMDDTKVLTPDGAGGVEWVASSAGDIEDMATSELDDTKILKPDGVGGVAWVAGGGGGDDIEDFPTSELSTAKYLVPDGAGGVIWDYLDHLVASDGSPNPALSVDATGNVGIGTAAPASKLEVVGTADDQQLIVKANATQTANIIEVKNSAGTVLDYIDPTGELSATDRIYVRGASSDIKLSLIDNVNADAAATAALSGFDKDMTSLWTVGNLDNTSNDLQISTDQLNGDILLQPNNTGIVIATSDIHPDSDGRGLMTRLVNGRVAYDTHFRGADAIPAGYAWQGAPFAAPTTATYNHLSDFLYVITPTSSREFMSRAVTNAAANWQNKAIYGRFTCGSNGRIGLRFDDGTDNNYAQVFVDGTANDGTETLKFQYRDGGGAVVTNASAILLPAFTFVILRLFMYWTGTQYQAIGYLFAPEIERSLTITGFSRVEAWPPVAGRAGIFVENPSGSGANPLYCDWFKNEFT